ncbi:MAG: pyridoxal phosphate-dependent aminotransferase family protein [candidate division WOR-3 bacterium]|nr:pyridoxal phosphate-dependent aminotransferase family protein [candidate division WOR-3 bacterium]MDW7987893.1 pyridoxal phosphate-dependent aminotransferase family protein [candidate division WOR-3 bacterium]
MDIFDKCLEYYPIVKRAKDTGFYPYFRALDSEPDRRVKIKGKELIMLGSNNYLGLTTHPKVKEAAIKAIEKYGTGCTGSRFLNGTLDLHEELEQKLAEFLNKEDCIVFSTGYQTNLGVISSLVRRGDVAIVDKLDHASIIDGCQMSFGRVVRFLHNDMADLERVLASLDKNCGKLIVVDGIFSMEGDIIDLPNVVRLAKKYGARIMVDDAHAIGVLGKRGAGTAEHFGLEDEVDLIMGTFSKSFATIGGFVAGEHKVITYIRHQARSLIFSASIPPPAVATVLAALEIIKNEPERRERLWHNTHKMLRGLKALGYNTEKSCTPIIPLHIGSDEKAINFWHSLYEGGIFANPVIPPAVPPGRSLIRTSYMATHTDEDLDEALAIFEKVGKKEGVI